MHAYSWYADSHHVDAHLRCVFKHVSHKKEKEKEKEGVFRRNWTIYSKYDN